MTIIRLIHYLTLLRLECKHVDITSFKHIACTLTNVTRTVPVLKYISWPGARSTVTRGTRVETTRTLDSSHLWCNVLVYILLTRTRILARDVVQCRRTISLQGSTSGSCVLAVLWLKLLTYNKFQYTWRGDYECEQPAHLPVLTRGSSSVPPGTTSTIRSPLGPRRIKQSDEKPTKREKET
jgi:hypothetical protein